MFYRLTMHINRTLVSVDAADAAGIDVDALGGLDADSLRMSLGPLPAGYYPTGTRHLFLYIMPHQCC